MKDLDIQESILGYAYPKSNDQDKDARIKELEKRYSDMVDTNLKAVNKIQSLTAILDEAENALIWYAVYADSIVLEHFNGKEISKKTNAKDVLQKIRILRGRE